MHVLCTIVVQACYQVVVLIAWSHRAVLFHSALLGSTAVNLRRASPAIEHQRLLLLLLLRARYVKYSNGYSESSHTIKMFWRVVAEMSAEQRSALLRFITSTSRAPLGGFKHLQPALTIHKVDCSSSPLAFLGGKDVDRLPSASTW
jgi:hypothetical protein